MLTPVECKNANTFEKVLDITCDIFKKDVTNKENRPMLKGMLIFIAIRFVSGKDENFWHVSSFKENTKFNINPCVNDKIMQVCGDNCQSVRERITLTNGEKRIICLYRALRVNWIKPIIEMYNSEDNHIKYWEKLDKKKGRYRIYIRYQENISDYVVIFEKKNQSKVQFITAFPVFDNRFKVQFNKDYEDYIKKNR